MDLRVGRWFLFGEGILGLILARSKLNLTVFNLPSAEHGEAGFFLNLRFFT
jgi:hypothetical protein